MYRIGYYCLMFSLISATEGKRICSVLANRNDTGSVNISELINTDFCQEIKLLGVIFTMDTPLTVANKTDIAVIGLDAGTTVQCLDNVGVEFRKSANIQLSNIIFKNCGSIHFPSFSAAILIVDSINLHIRNAIITGSNGTGLVLINVQGSITISNALFVSNELESGQLLSGGGGVYIGMQDNPTTGAEYIIHNCTFLYNGAKIRDETLTCDSGIYSGIGWGGALSIRMINNLCNTNIVISDSILSNNMAGWGGGVELVMCRTNNTHVAIDNSKIINNTATKYGGGGINIEFSGLGTQNNTVIVKRTQFERNLAKYGGGLAISTHYAFNQKNNSVSCYDCAWKGNIAHYGSAVDFYTAGIIDSWYEIPDVVFEDCSFESNYHENVSIDDNVIFRLGEGVIMITGLSIMLRGHITFFNNSGSCIYAISSQVKFENGVTAVFQNNIAEKGAGIALIGYSVIVVGNDSDITFSNNTATDTGGAIYYYSIDKHIYVLENRCFIQSIDFPASNIRFKFVGNVAPIEPNYKNSQFHENSIFSTADLSECCDNETHCTFGGIGEFSFDNESSDNKGYSSSQKQLITTNERRFNFTINTKLLFIPGNSMNLPIQGSNESFKVTIGNDKNVWVSPSYYTINSNRLQMKSTKIRNKATISLVETSNRKYSLSFIAQAQNCPPFYNLSEGKCICYGSNDVYYFALFTCSRTAMMSSSLHIGYWVGYDHAVNTTVVGLIYSNCPNGYCNPGKSAMENYFQLPNDTTDLDKTVCSSGRKGRLCGECTKNTTVYFYTRKFTCGPTKLCHLGPLFYLLSEILPLTILYLLLTFFNISFTSGDLNGFILFAQMIDTVVDVGKHYTYYTYYYGPFYRLFNLDFGGDYIEYCLWKNADTMSILMFKYVTILHVLLMVIVTVIMIRVMGMCKCARLRKIRYSVIQGFSTFLVLSYSQCAELSFSILNPSIVYEGKEVKYTVAFLQGTMIYFSSRHLPYALPALLLILCFIIPLPLMLILQPLCNKIILLLQLDEHKVVKFAAHLTPTNRIKPLLDCFQSPFKDNYRFFGGMYFLYRASILACRYAPTSTLALAVTGLLLILILTIHTVLQPYQKKIHNLIDALLIANLAIIVTLRLIMEVSAATKTSPVHLLAIQIINTVLIFIPFIVLCFYSCYKITKKVRDHIKKRGMFIRESQTVDTDLFLEDDVREEHQQKLTENFVLMQAK